MPFYSICFPAGVMDATEADLPAVGAAANAVVEEAREAGVLVFAGGLLESTAPVRVAGDGSVIDGPYPQNAGLSGGLTILELPSHEAAEHWAARIAVACRCPQEIREYV